MEQAVTKPYREVNLSEQLNLFHEIVTHDYLTLLKDCEIVPLNHSENPKMRWYKITKIVIEKDVFFADKLSMLYTSLHHTAKNVVLVLHKENEGNIELYLGARDFGGNKLISGEILKSGLEGYMPGVKIQSSKSLKHIKYDEPFITSVSALGTLRDDKKDSFVQGLERLIDASSSIPKFTAYFVAENVSSNQANSMINAFCDIQSQLSTVSEVHLTYSDSETKGVSDSITRSFSETLTENISRTVTRTEGTSENITNGESDSTSHSDNRSKNIVHSLCSTLFGGRTGSSDSTSHQTNWSKQTGWNVSNAIGDQTGTSKGKQQGQSDQHQKNQSNTTGTSRQITIKNFALQNFIKLIDKQVERINNGIPFGLWSVSSYFVAPTETTSVKLANLYRGCIIGEESGIENCAINTWCKPTDCEAIYEYLTNSLQPRFIFDGINVSPGTVVTSKELAIHLSLPQTSVPGILVREEQPFGRNVITDDKYTPENSIAIGIVQHLGETFEDEIVSLGINGLSKHTLVTGTTGSGKSNTLYLLLSELIKKGIKFLVIEPAKGEYKEVFGSDPSVSVYGSNPRISDLLTINPFAFPEDIDVYEHIDALVEIFNACWPMYAAMPQVLKHSIIEAYKTCGWDLEKSYNPNGVFPTVADVLDSLKDYINSSEYSSDTKGDYKGSLETRLQSLCDGIVGRMFNGTPISDKQLFDTNVIIDISRVKSSETKSLIMGLLVLKLNEYRSSEHKGMNLPLRHITVLEEAHNLLKRTSTAQSAESSNVAGMAVEKIANSMAEMRTYGEGFIIADQSPSMLDLAAIRNTNTKILMALPEKEDREAAGKSIGLDDSHIEEISKLKTGEAIIYQTSWEEPVRTKVSYCPIESTPWSYKFSYSSLDAHNSAVLAEIFNILYKCYTSVDADINRAEFFALLAKSTISGGRLGKIKQKLNSIMKPSNDDIAFIFVTIVGTSIFESASKSSDVDVMNSNITRSLSEVTGLSVDSRMRTFLNMYMKGCSDRMNDAFYKGWLEATLNK